MKPMNIEKIEKLMENDKKARQKLESFEKILLNIEDIEPQKMHLWLEIYTNATNDRAAASALMSQAFMQLGSAAIDHISLGPMLVKYLERMNKSNDQLLSLAIVVAKEIEKVASVNSDDIFAQIEG